jgi:membrane-bound lytic murein transglycosylase A
MGGRRRSGSRTALPVKLLRGLLPLLLGTVFFAGCAPGAGVYRLDDRQVHARPLSDDRDFRGLAEAVRGSLRYYGRLPDTVAFQYGSLTYTAREMEASMVLFLEIIEEGRGEERLDKLREKFLFFESRNDEGKAFFTGYYEPVLPGSLSPSREYSTPLYAVPADLVVIDLDPYVNLGLLPADLENRRLRGKLEGKKVVPFDDRSQISWESSLEGRAEPLVYLANQVELAFLQIQGSGMIRLEDGSLMRVNYADQNGHPYRAIGRVLLDRIPREEMSLQKIKEYLYRHPEEERDILDYNPSYTFFRPVDEGPLGSIEVPLTAGRSMAMDHRLLPRGGLVFIETSYSPESLEAGGAARFSRFGVVQDTGGAIRGHGRADIFWGSGEEAERIAGPMKEEGRIFLLVARKEYLGVRR